MSKIYWIRHGQAQHNVLADKIGEESYRILRDPELTLLGINQAKECNKIMVPENIELVLVSPLTRTLQTAKLIFTTVSNEKKNDSSLPKIKMISYDELLEYPQGNHICNYRKNKSMLIELFPFVEYNITETIEWSPDKETYTDLDKRINRIRMIINNLIKKEKYKKIAVVCHNSLMKRVLQRKDEIIHCYPYVENIDKINKI